MTSWLLILTLILGGATETRTARFQSEAACETAGNTAKSNLEPHTNLAPEINVAWECVPDYKTDEE